MPDIYYRYTKYAIMDEQITNSTFLGLTPLIFDGREDEYFQRSLVIRPSSKSLTMLKLGFDRLPPNYSMNYRSYNSLLGNFVIDGSGELNGETFKKGDFFYTDPNVKNRIISSPDSTLQSFWFQIYGSYTDDIMQKLGEISPFRIMKYRADTGLESFFRLMLENDGIANTDKRFSRGVIDILLSFIASPNDSELFRSDALPRSVRIAGRAMRIMDESYATVTVETLADMLHINRKYLCNEFTSAVGMSPQGYLIKCKLRGAANYLTETDYPIQKIVELVGYNHRNSFVTAFRRIYGCTPTEYRKRSNKT